MCLRSIQCFKLNNNFLNRWMRPFKGPTIIPMHKRTILVGEITQISYGAKITITTHGQTIQTTSNIPINFPIINPTFQITIIILPTIHPNFQIINKTFQLSSTIFLPKSSTWEENDWFSKKYGKLHVQESLMQTVQRLVVQISQLVNPQNERLKGILPSQALTNPRNSQ